MGVAKLTVSRQRRLFAILQLGEGLSAAARAVGVSPQAIRKRARRDPVFSARLAAARGGGEPDPVSSDDWTAAARMLELEFPESWGLDVDESTAF